MTSCPRVLMLWVVLLLCPALAAEEPVVKAAVRKSPRFTQPPAARRTEGAVTITFAIGAPGDVAVWIQDARGRTVRHLAAGMLGHVPGAPGTPPPPPLQEGLAQRLTWDGRDDRGRAVPAGCTVRVGLGLDARFDRIIGYDPQTVGTIAATAHDPKGNLYVLSHDDYPLRSTPVVQVFDPAGKYLRTLLPWPANAPPDRVRKHWIEIAPGRRVPRVHHPFQALYPVQPKDKLTWEQVVKFSGEDLKLTPDAKPAKLPAGTGLFRPMHLVASRTRDEIFVRQWAGAKWTRFDGRTGRATPLPLKNVADLTAAPDGSLCGHQANNRLVRLDRDGKITAVLDDKVLGTVRGGNYRGVRGLDVAPNGDVYLLHYAGVQPGSFKGLGETGPKWSRLLLDVYPHDGKPPRHSVLQLSAGAGGVRVDRDGNIHVASPVMPEGRPVPPEFARLTGRARATYEHLYGSILKFGPKGGRVDLYRRREKAPDEGVHAVSRHWSGPSRARILGDLRGVFPDVAPTGTGGAGYCTCYVPRFDLDPFGRLFVPEVPRFSIKVLDGRGNLLRRIGQYGNADSAGPNSALPDPPIVFAWPAYVGVTRQAVYVSDMLNRRVMRIRLVYRTEAACPVP